MRVLVKFVAAALLVLSLGLHWALLQTVAWTGMVLRYAHEGSVAEALSKTFDGRHPCRLCKAIDQGRAEEQQRGAKQVKPGTKLEVALPWERPEFRFASCFEQPSRTIPNPLGRQEEPPKPRPRLAGVGRLA